MFGNILLCLALVCTVGACAQRNFNDRPMDDSMGKRIAEHIRNARVVAAVMLGGTILSILTVEVWAQTPSAVIAPAAPNQLLALASNFVMEMLTLAAPIVLAFFSFKLNQWFGLNQDAKHREALQQTLENGAGKMVQAAASAGQTLVIGSIERNKALAEGLAYVEAAAPDAIKYFNLTRDSLIEKMEAKIGLKLADNQKG